MPHLPLTEEHVRPFVGIYWDFFGLDHGDQGKEALIKFLVEFGREKGREKYNLENVEPVQWGFVNGFDKGYEAGYQEHVKAFEEASAINNAIIEENERILAETRQECNRIQADVEAVQARLEGIAWADVEAMVRAEVEARMPLQKDGINAARI